MYNYRYSYSGSDAEVYAIFPNKMMDWAKRNRAIDYDSSGAYTTNRDIGEEVSGLTRLETAHTVSFSVYEPRGAARALGYRGVKGFARAIRTIAGSMIFTVVEKHPLQDLFEIDAPNAYIGNRLSGWAMDATSSGSAFDRNRISVKLATTLSPFDLMIRYVSEAWNPNQAREFASVTSKVDPNDKVGYGLQVPSAALLIQGVEFISEGQTTSINDMVTEVTYQFVARDLKELSLSSVGVAPGSKILEGELAGYAAEFYSRLTPGQGEAGLLNAAFMQNLTMGDQIWEPGWQGPPWLDAPTTLE
jgi:hypothetical protein